jgi:phosphoribosylformylglycinamidine cyclo-ligase
MGLTYADSGVDRKGRERAKRGFRAFESTFPLSIHGKVISTPFNTLYPIGNDVFHVKTCDGIGTKVLLSEAAGKHDTIGIDAVAMVVNDCIRCGARPIALTNAIDIKRSEPVILAELQKGLQKGAELSGCPLIGGETADVPELLNTLYHINCDCAGEVHRNDIISGDKIMPGNVVIGMRSSGPHSNGISLLRRALFRKWGGSFDFTDVPDGFDSELLSQAIEPTRIYVKDFLRIRKGFDILGAVHITGDAYLKFRKLTDCGFVFDNFRPQRIFSLVKECGRVEDREMFRTFNMGWGFALVVREEDADNVMQKLPDSERIGKVSKGRGVAIIHGGRKFLL